MTAIEVVEFRSRVCKIARILRKANAAMLSTSEYVTFCESHSREVEHSVVLRGEMARKRYRCVMRLLPSDKDIESAIAWSERLISEMVDCFGSDDKIPALFSECYSSLCESRRTLRRKIGLC